MSFFTTKTKLFARAVFISLFILVGLFAGLQQVQAVWNGILYQPGTTLDPECTPTQTSCNIVPPVSQSGDQSLSGTLTVTSTTAAGLSLNPYGTNPGNTSELRLLELAANGSNFVAFKSVDNLTGDVVWTLPNADGTLGQVLSTDGSGALSWTSSPAMTLTDSLILVGNGSNVATGVALSGDATISNAGVLTISNDVVTLAKLAADAVNSAKIVDGSITNADISATAAILYSKLSLGNSIVLADLTADSVNSSKIIDGSIVAADLASGAVTSVKILDGTITNVDVSATAAIALSKLASGTSGQIIVGNASGVPTYAALSGDATISNAGVLTIGANAIDGTNISITGETSADLLVFNGTDWDDVALSGDATVTNAGVLTIAANAITTGKILDGTLLNADISATAAIALSKLASGTSGQIIVGNASGVPTYAALSGDATISNAGVLTIAANAITTGKILDGTLLNADISATAAIALSKLASGTSIVTSLTAPTGTNANGGSISSNILTLSLADGTNPGLVSTGAQTIAGAKTFSGLSSFTGSGTGLAVTNNATVGGTLGVTGATTLSSTLAVNGSTSLTSLTTSGNTTLGDATGDTLTINSTAVSTPNNLNIDTNTLFVDATNNRVGIGTANPGASLEVASSTVAGATWTTHFDAYFGNKDVAYGNGIYVSVVDTNAAFTSTDGISWTQQSISTASNWRGVTYANGLFVAVGSVGVTGTVMTSPDGVTWTDRTPAANNTWESVTYGNNLFVAVGSSGSGNRVMTSPDGITWTSQTSASDDLWRDVTYGNNLFVAVSFLGSTYRVMTSPDGITWTGLTAINAGWNSITYGEGLFVAVGESSPYVMTSPDGITWTSRTAAATNSWRAVTYGNGIFVAVAGSGTGNRVMTSYEGITWISQVSAEDNNWNGITYANDLFVAVADSGTNRVMTASAVSGVAIIANGGITVAGNIAPIANDIYDLGSTANRFRNQYLSGDAIIGGAMTVTGTSTFSGSVDIASARTSGLTMNGNITAESVPTAVTQNIVTADTLTKIIGVTNGTVGQYTSVVLDASGSPVIAYYNGSNSALDLARCADASCTSWTINEVDNADAVGQFNAMVLNGSGNAVISYYDGTNGDLKVARCENAACSKATISVVDSVNVVGQYTSIELNASGNPVVSHYDATNIDLRLAVCGNATCSSGNTLTIVDSAGSVGQYTSLKLNTSGNPVISYYAPTGLDLKVAVCSNATCSASTITIVDSTGSVGLYTSLVLTGSNIPIISYYDATNFALKVAVCSVATCTSSTLVTLDSSADVGTITTSIVLNAAGRPVVSYYDATNDNLKLTLCGNTACSSGNTTSVVESLGDVGQYSSLVLNASGNPVITSYDVSKLDLIVNLCSTANCSSSTKKTLDGTYQATGEYASMKLDASGNAIIAYHEHSLPSGGMLMVKHCADSTCSTATTTAVDSTSGSGQHISMILDSSGNPVISYYESTAGDLKVAHCADTDCTSRTVNIVDSTGVTGQFTSIVLDASGNPVISYYDATAFDLKVAHCADANCASATTTVVDSANVVGQYTSIQLDASGFPIVSYYDVTNVDLKVAHCTDADCTGATLTVVDSDNNVGTYTSMKLNGAGNPVISYFHPTTANLKLAVCANTDCSSATLSFVEVSLSNVGGWNSLELDASSNPVVSYTDNTNGNLKLVHCNDTFCAGNNETINIVDAPGSVGQYTALALDASGNPVIAYYDFGNGALKFAHCTDVNCSASTGGFSIGSATNFFKNIFASDIYAKTMTMNGFDLAEGYMSDDNLTYGELVTVADSQNLITGIPDGDAYVARATTPYQAELIGVVSTAPGVYLSNWQDGKQRYPVALAGRVPTKVTTENGAIKPGDPITASSLAGAGMKATEAGRVVGVALEGYASEDTTAVGTILVFVNPEWYSGNDLAHSTVSSSQLEKLVISGALTVGNLEVLGESIFRNIATFTADANFEKAVVFAGDVTFKGRALFEDQDMAGFAKITLGQDKVVVTYEKEYPQAPVVQISLASVELSDIAYEVNTLIKVCSKDESREVCAEKATKDALSFNRGYAVVSSTPKGFTILLENPALYDLTFNWIAIPVKNARTQINEVTPTPDTVVEEEGGVNNENEASPAH